MPSKTVFITGANGYIGSAVARAFSRDGWTTYGLIRSTRSGRGLMREEVIPIVGTATDASAIISDLPPVDVIITCDEDISSYVPHHQNRLSMIKQICRHSVAHGNVKPLVIFSSGCKDYGMTPMHGEEGLEPHTENSPLNPPDLLRPRTKAAMDMLTTHVKDFDCVVTRPTTLYGCSGSYYSYFFSLAERAKKENGGVLELPADPNVILHGTHVEDVAAAYLTLATAPRQLVAGQVYNISGHRYETLSEIVPAIEKSHGIQVRFRDFRPQDEETFGLYVLSLFTFPQWVGSEKLRKDTGWVDKMPLFHQGYEVYRGAYEAAMSEDPEQVERMFGRKARGTLQARQP
ncbi:uncharacterized protein A1O5_03026 [Cladophialophora psammophila CBS 110553]|uniref:NAD-dependent epimerase/dehydratase domain-containing protein n=1 Tax=Cladophialophora psammophila CBS 110553 TaxID=1182543 RepID=W9X8L4_9EURO|nr:uncharacterized protein A1O5_03026 [Cladophialophora psammophila CBS 110553]EXJ73266.1 hypothetical protein A1O5_03026 [Cladophialophora psammophila CBS 110553]